MGLWMQRMLVDIGSAQDTVVASPWFDRKDVTDALVHRMGSVAAVTVLVDSAAFRERSCFRMRPRLMELVRAGADVYLCKGSPPFGIFHIKAVCTDRRVLYTGSGNITEKMSSNVELLLRVVGPPVLDVLRSLDEARGAETSVYVGSRSASVLDML